MHPFKIDYDRVRNLEYVDKNNLPPQTFSEYRRLLPPATIGIDTKPKSTDTAPGLGSVRTLHPAANRSKFRMEANGSPTPIFVTSTPPTLVSTTFLHAATPDSRRPNTWRDGISSTWAVVPYAMGSPLSDAPRPDRCRHSRTSAVRWDREGRLVRPLSTVGRDSGARQR